MPACQTLQGSWKKSPKHDRDNGTQPGAGADANDAGVGKRIAEQTLHCGTRHGKCRAHKDPHHQPRQTDIQHHDCFDLAKRRAGHCFADKSAEPNLRCPGFKTDGC